MADDDAAILQELQEASAGLLYPSESDTPFDLVCWKTIGSTPLPELTAGMNPGRKIERVPLEQFFGQLKDADEAERFMRLKDILQSRLRDLTVWRVGAGEVEVDIYLIGKTPSGIWAGLHTKSVET